MGEGGISSCKTDIVPDDPLINLEWMLCHDDMISGH